MSITSISQRQKTTSRSWLSASSDHLAGSEENSKVQETIWRLQDEVKVLQEELARTRRALDQRELLLRNSRQRELELRAEIGAEKR